MAASALLLLATTPPTYHRIVSPTLCVPGDQKISVPVGLLACQRDPLLRALDTSIVSVRVAQPAGTPAGNKKKKNASAGQPLLEVILHDTVVFPEGGGQPSDIGTMTTADGREWSIIECKRHGGHAVHYINAAEADAEHFAIGAEVTVELGEDGFKRRLDHMCMHTSQHMLSALLETRLNLPTLSWALTAHPTPSYVELPRSMTVEEITAIQEEANRLVFEGRQVHVEVEELDREELPDVVKLESGRSVGKALPSDYTGGVKRTVVIDGVDRNPCCGTHLPSLHNLQIFLIPQTEAMSRSNTTSARLYFLCGPRLLAHLSATHDLLMSTATLFSCGPPLVPSRTAQAIEERKAADGRVRDLELELATSIAKAMSASAAAQQPDAATGFTQHLHRTDDSSNPLLFLQSIASAFVGEGRSEPYLIVLSSSPSSQSATSTSVVLAVGSDEAKVKAVGELLKSKLSIKGGGKGPRWSGKFVGVWRDHKEGSGVEEAIESVFRG